MLTSGTEIGALLVDGLGDGVAIECPSEDLEFLRLMSFGLLQARASAACETLCWTVILYESLHVIAISSFAASASCATGLVG